MVRKSTAGTRQLSVEIDAAIREQLDARKVAERRNLRAVVEQALVYYFAKVPVDRPPTVPSPKRGRPRKAKGE